MSIISPQLLQSILDIATSCTSITELVNKFTGCITQTLTEVLGRSNLLGPAIKIPDCIQQIGNFAKNLQNNQFLNQVLSMAGQKGSGASKAKKEISNFMNILDQVAGGDYGQIFKKVLDAQFGIEENTFTELEHVVQTLKNGAGLLS